MQFKMKGKWGEDTVSLAQKLCEEGVVGKGRERGTDRRELEEQNVLM